MATAHPSWGPQGPSAAHLPSIPGCGAPAWLGVSPHLGVLIRAWGDSRAYCVLEVCRVHVWT